MDSNKVKYKFKQILDLLNEIESSKELDCISVGEFADEATLMGTRDSFTNLCRVLVKNIYDSFESKNKEDNYFFFDEIKQIISDYGNFWPTGLIVFDDVKDYIESIKYDNPKYFLYLRAMHSDLLEKYKIDNSIKDLVDFDRDYKHAFESENNKSNQ